MSEVADRPAMPTDAEEDLYQALILDRARHPHHGKPLECHDADAVGDNPMCGDRLRLTLRRDAVGRIADAGFDARGCAISLAAADLMIDAVVGRGADEATDLADAFERMVRTGVVPDGPAFAALRALAGVHQYRSRTRCALLPWSALRDALGSSAAPSVVSEEPGDGE